MGFIGRYLQGLPHPRHPGEAVGLGTGPDVQWWGLGLTTGSGFVLTVVGYGWGVTVITVGGNVVPPLMLVLLPCVCVSSCRVQISEP